MIQIDVVAVGLIRKTRSLDDLRLFPLGKSHEFKLKINILGLVARRIGVGDVRSHRFLARAQQIHVAFEIGSDSVEHNEVGGALRLPILIGPDRQTLSPMRKNLAGARRRAAEVVPATFSLSALSELRQ